MAIRNTRSQLVQKRFKLKDMLDTECFALPGTVKLWQLRLLAPLGGWLGLTSFHAFSGTDEVIRALGFLKRLDAEGRLQRDRHPVRQNPPAEHIDDRRQIDEAASIRPIGERVVDTLKAIKKHGDNPFVLTGIRNNGGAYASMPNAWRRVIKNTPDLTDITVHTLCHAFASVAGDLGYADSTIATMLGH